MSLDEFMMDDDCMTDNDGFARLPRYGTGLPIFSLPCIPTIKTYP